MASRESTSTAPDDHHITNLLPTTQSSPTTLINPPTWALKATIDHLHTTDAGTVSILAPEHRYDNLFEGFHRQAKTADLIDANRLTLATGTFPSSGLVITPNQVTALLSTPTTATTVTVDTDSFHSTARQAALDALSDAQSYSLRTPGLTTIRTTLAERFDDDTLATFDAYTTATTNGQLDGVYLTLLTAAQTTQPLYEISHWGERINLGSRPTYSRKKQILEDANIIETSKIPQEIGRPRYRLHLADDLTDQPPQDVIATTANRITDN